MKRFYDAKWQADPDYKPGDKVYQSRAHLVTHHLMKKFEAWRYGPFTVVRKVGAISYRLKLPNSWKVHLVFNTVFLHPWGPPVAAHQHHDNPPPDVVDGVDLYKIAEVLKISLNKWQKHLQYSSGRVMGPRIIPGNNWSTWGILLSASKNFTIST
jgi:hypothetical protein